MRIAKRFRQPALIWSVVLLALFDSAATWIGWQHGLIDERNPLMRALLERGDTSFLWFKGLSVGLLLVLVGVGGVPRRGPAWVGLWIVCLAYAGAAVSHGWWMVQVFSFIRTGVF